MKPDLLIAGTQLLSSEPVPASPEELADRAVAAFRALEQHLAHIVGDLGIQTVFRRALVLAAVNHPWLASTKPDFAQLRAAFAAQPPEIAIDAFVAVLSTFVAVLGRLIGETLVWRLLGEVWPSIFPEVAQEAP